jgi:hypothetical protein
VRRRPGGRGDGTRSLPAAGPRAGGGFGACHAGAGAVVVAVPDAINGGTPFDVTARGDAFDKMEFGCTGTPTFGAAETLERRIQLHDGRDKKDQADG